MFFLSLFPKDHSIMAIYIALQYISKYRKNIEKKAGDELKYKVEYV